ncbi:MAG: hypothetical protein JNJ73_02010 [Hyphomonadaceae bacterium]|nr:hypothetical protein [Hyphomonadaceae bacterium]
MLPRPPAPSDPLPRLSWLDRVVIALRSQKRRRLAALAEPPPEEEEGEEEQP